MEKMVYLDAIWTPVSLKWKNTKKKMKYAKAVVVKFVRLQLNNNVRLNIEAEFTLLGFWLWFSAQV